jgi:hypothetical protein
MAAFHGVPYSKWTPSSWRRAAMRKRLEGTLEDIAQRAAETRVFGPEYGATVTIKSSRSARPDPAKMTDQAIVDDFETLLQQRKISTKPGVKAAQTKRLKALVAEAHKREARDQ